MNTEESDGVVYSVKNPLHFIKNDTIAKRDENGNVVYDKGKIQYTQLGYWTKGGIYKPDPYNSAIIWNDPYATSDKKSIFYPCPPGYRLPPNSVWEDFTPQGNTVKYPIPTTNAY